MRNSTISSKSVEKHGDGISGNLRTTSSTREMCKLLSLILVEKVSNKKWNSCKTRLLHKNLPFGTESNTLSCCFYMEILTGAGLYFIFFASVLALQRNDSCDRASFPAEALLCALRLQDGSAPSPDVAERSCQPQPEPVFSHQIVSNTERAHCAEQRRCPSAPRPWTVIYRGLCPKQNCFLNPFETRR